MQLDAFTTAYIEAALWSTNDESTPAGGEPFDRNYGPEDIAPETLAKMVEDCKKFQADNEHLITDENCNYKRCSVDEYAGHDFWLTRCGHGAGFFDGDWEEPAGELLTAAAKRFGEYNLYAGDDGLIYGS